MTAVLDTPATDGLDGVLAEIAARRDEFGRQRFVPKDVIANLKRAGLYRAATPRRFGGDALPPAEFLRKIERISAVDASAGWVASFGSALVYFAALPLDTQAELYKDGPDLVFAGGLFPVQQAECDGGGTGMSGRVEVRQRMQGRRHPGCRHRRRRGGQRQAAHGAAAAGPGRDRGELGRGRTAGHRQPRLRVDGVDVPEEWTFIRGGEPTVDEPLYRYPAIAYAAQVLAVVNLGAGRAALDYAIEIGAGRTGITGAPKLADRAYYRIDIAKAEAALRSAAPSSTRSPTRSTPRSPPAIRPRTSRRRSCAWPSTHVGQGRRRGRADRLLALRDRRHLRRQPACSGYLRDASVVTQHAFLGDGIYDGAGAVLMDIPPSIPAFI